MAWHAERVWQVSDVADAAELASKLTTMTWCACNGFRLDGYLFLNDATSPDGAQEYAVVKEATGQQVESITMSWIAFPRAVAYINGAIRGEFDNQHLGLVDVKTRIQTPAEHGRCSACA